jgi:hypothetical protein
MVLLAFLALVFGSVDFLVASTGEVSWMGASTTRFCSGSTFIYVFVISHLQYCNNSSSVARQHRPPFKFLPGLRFMIGSRPVLEHKSRRMDNGHWECRGKGTKTAFSKGTELAFDLRN